MQEWVTNIQWKGTDLCMDFVCPKCGTYDHFDGFFLWEIKCESCGTIWEMPTDIFSLMKEKGHTDELEGKKHSNVNRKKR